MSVQNMPVRPSYLAVSIQVPTTRATLASLISTMLSITPGRLAGSWRSVNLQLDPETSSGSTIRRGTGNVGDTLNGVVQKGATLLGLASIFNEATFNNVDISTIWVMALAAATTGAENILNIELFAE
jgi:hypothetical protein